MVAYLDDMEEVGRVAAAGSYRRRKETVGDLDILATGEEGKKIIERFVQYEDVKEVVSQCETRSTVVLCTGIHVDLWVVHPKGRIINERQPYAADMERVMEAALAWVRPVADGWNVTTC